ncbi:MAG TPA: NADH:flavin oxidoreductase/NADH oxidase [Burkholderiaceae bacterium]|nr:NADH:flavin oxidoreductase/NADH oxidase [Burkholderiaceae bacterium]
MPRLFTPFSLRQLTLRNRVVVSPMCQYSAVNGCATDWHRAHLGQFAIGDAGLLMLEATAVEAIGRITPGCLGLYDDATEQALAGVMRMLRSVSGIPIGIQLGHAGRKGSSARPWEGGALLDAQHGGWRPIAPSAVPQLEHEPPPRALEPRELPALRQRFVDAVLRADRLGFDSIELHAAHGYLLHQFLSPIANRRADDYGGSLANRMRFPLEVFEAARAAWPQHKPMGVRISATDWVDGGWDLEQSIAFVRELHTRGCDWIDVSSGGVSPQQQIKLGPGYQVPFAAAIKSAVPIPVIAVGLITEPEQAEAIVAEGQADLVALARAMLYDPRWVWHAAAKLGATVQAPSQYWRSQPREHPKLFEGVTFGAR